MEPNDPEWIELRNRINEHNLSLSIDDIKHSKNLRIVRAEMHRQLFPKTNSESLPTAIWFELFPMEDGFMAMSPREFRIATQTAAIELGCFVTSTYNPEEYKTTGYRVHIAWGIC